MKQVLLLLTLTCCLQPGVFSQNIGIGTQVPHSSAKLDVQSQNSGLLIPRMSSVQRNAISQPGKGLLVFDNDKNSFMYFDGTRWVSLASSGNNQTPPTRLEAPITDSTYKFGYSLSIDSNFAAISSSTYAASGATTGYGQVHIYEKSADGNWALHTKLTAPAPVGSSGYFGYSTDLSGDYLIVGDPLRKNSSDVSIGAAFIYRRTGNAWNLEATLQRSLGASGDYFGFDVAIDVAHDGTVRAVIGAPQHGAGSNTGFVQVYRKNSSGFWVSEQNITASGLSVRASAGYSVDIDDSLVVYGAPYYDYTYNDGTTVHDIGRVLIYRYTGTQWILDHNYVTYTSGLGVGFSVGVSKGTVVAGAPNFADGSSGYGHVILLTKNTGSWQSSALAPPMDIIQYGPARFGMAVSIYKNNLLVGAPAGLNHINIYDYFGNRPGSAFLYRFNLYQGNPYPEYSLLSRFESGRLNNRDLFGHSVAIGRGSFIISDHYKMNETLSKSVGSVLFGSVD